MGYKVIVITHSTACEHCFGENLDGARAFFEAKAKSWDAIRAELTCNGNRINTYVRGGKA